eukprot:502109-Pyramimonas_sp.AAC.1
MLQSTSNGVAVEGLGKALLRGRHLLRSTAHTGLTDFQPPESQVTSTGGMQLGDPTDFKVPPLIPLIITNDRVVHSLQ